MNMEDETELLRITEDDVVEANQLSLACPICAGPVENGATERELAPVVCVECNTLYHHVCWGNNGGKCAILGCNSVQCQPYGVQEPMLTINLDEVPSTVEVSKRNQRLKRIEQGRRRTQPQSQPTPQPGFWRRVLNFFFGSDNSAQRSNR